MSILANIFVSYILARILDSLDHDSLFIKSSVEIPERTAFDEQTDRVE